MLLLFCIYALQISNTEIIIILILNILLGVVFLLLKDKKKYAKKYSNQKLKTKKIMSRFNECNRSFNAMFNNTSDGVALLNLQLDLFKSNQNLCRMLGYTMERILKWNMKQLFSDTFLSEHQLEINKLIANTAKTYNCKQKFIKKNGEMIWILITLSLILDDHNQPNYFIMHIKHLESEVLTSTA